MITVTSDSFHIIFTNQDSKEFIIDKTGISFIIENGNISVYEKNHTHLTFYYTEIPGHETPLDVINYLKTFLNDTVGYSLSPVADFLEFGSANNLSAAVGSEIIFDVTRYSSIGFHIKPPTGGLVQFQGSFDGTNFSNITMREIGANGYTQQSSLEQDFIGSVSCLRKIKFKVILGGSSPGTVMGKFSKVASTLEGVEHTSAPHLFGFEPLYQDFEFLTAQTNKEILTPPNNKKFVITDLIFTSDAVNEVTMFDGTNAPGNVVVKLKTGQERFFSHSFRGVVKSKITGNSLKLTSTTNSDFRGTIIYYLIDG